MIVSLEQDAAYVRRGDAYVEVCRSCGAERAGDTCPCGARFERLQRKFLTAAWKPARIEPQMPAVCPHCEGPPSVVRSITMRQPTGINGLGYTLTRLTVEVPSCRKMLPPFAAYLLFVIAMFWTVVFGLAAVFGNIVAVPLLVLAIAGAVAAWRAYGWIRFAGFDHRSFRFRVRRPGYARALADANRGRIG